MTTERARSGDVAAPPRRLVRLERDRVATAADLAAGVGVGGLVTLGQMYATEVPKGGPYRFGTANDVLGVACSLLAMPVLAELTRELPPGASRDVLLQVARGASLVGAASGALLVARLLPFVPSTVVSVCAMEAQAGWMAVANHQLLGRPEFPRSVGRLGRLIGVGMLAGGAVAGTGALVPRGSAAQRAAFVAGGLPGVAAWVAWPLWLHLVAGYLRTSDGTVASVHPQ